MTKQQQNNKAKKHQIISILATMKQLIPKKKIKPNQVKPLDLSTRVWKMQRAEESIKWPFGDVISKFENEGKFTGQKAKIFQKINCKEKKKGERMENRLKET